MIAETPRRGAMERNFKLNLEPIRNRLGLTRAELAARTGLRADRIGVLEKNKFEQLSVEELDALFRFAAPGELFSAWERSVFYGARQSGRLKVFIPLHSVPVAGGEESLYSSVYDEEARDVVEHAVSRGIAVESVRLRPRPPTEEVANEIEKLVPQGSVVSLGSQLTSDFNEIAMALMFEARLASPLSPTFDNREIRGFELVPESEAGGVTHLPSRLDPKKEEQ
jgi:transcriptional regulator with XRE-family HTH domain